MKILFVASEAAPYVKTGGLGDVIGALPRALAARGHDILVVIPATARSTPSSSGCATPARRVEVQFPNLPPAHIHVHAAGRAAAVPLPAEPLVRPPRAVRRERQGLPRQPQALRPALRRARWKPPEQRNFIPDAVHAHDWQTALVPADRQARLGRAGRRRSARGASSPSTTSPTRAFPAGGHGRAGPARRPLQLRRARVLREPQSDEGGPGVRREAHHRLAHLCEGDRQAPRSAPASKGCCATGAADSPAS